MAHQKEALLESRAFFLCSVFGKAVPGAPSGTRTARARRPAYQRAKTVQWTVFRARVPVVPDWLERGLGPPTDGAPKRSLAGKQGFFLMFSLRESSTRCAIGDENSCGGDRRQRRKQGAGAGAEVAEVESRAKGLRPMRAPQPVRARRSASRFSNSPVDCWKVRGSQRGLISGKGGTIP